MDAAEAPCTCPTCGSPYMDERPRVDLGRNIFICSEGSIRLTPKQSEILSVILDRYPNSVAVDTILTRVYSGINEPDTGEATLRTQICHARARIRSFGWTIKPTWAGGYFLERTGA